jgi:hypothetical protein
MKGLHARRSEASLTSVLAPWSQEETAQNTHSKFDAEIQEGLDWSRSFQPQSRDSIKVDSHPDYSRLDSEFEFQTRI